MINNSFFGGEYVNIDYEFFMIFINYVGFFLEVFVKIYGYNN